MKPKAKSRRKHKASSKAPSGVGRNGKESRRLPAPPTTPFLTPFQVADLMQVKETTVRLWLQRGLLKGTKIGHTWRVHRKVLEEFSNTGVETQ